MNKIKGNVFKLGQNIDTDQILPGYAMSYPVNELKDFALCGSAIPDFAKRVKVGDVILADDNFGCGSSREQAPVALKNSGLGIIVASSYARIFRRNAINIGLPVITTDYMENIKKETGDNDQLEIDIENAILVNLTNGKEYKLNKLSETTLETLSAGGLINKVKKILKDRGEVNV